MEMETAEREHVTDEDAKCWCNPYIEYVTAKGSTLRVHRQEDGELPPPELLIEAIADMAFDDTEDNV